MEFACGSLKGGFQDCPFKLFLHLLAVSMKILGEHTCRGDEGNGGLTERWFNTQHTQLIVGSLQCQARIVSGTVLFIKETLFTNHLMCHMPMPFLSKKEITFVSLSLE